MKVTVSLQETQSHVEQIGRDVKHLQGDVRQGQEAHAEGLATLHRHVCHTLSAQVCAMCCCICQALDAAYALAPVIVAK